MGNSHGNDQTAVVIVLAVLVALLTVAAAALALSQQRNKLPVTRVKMPSSSSLTLPSEVQMDSQLGADVNGLGADVTSTTSTRQSPGKQDGELII